MTSQEWGAFARNLAGVLCRCPIYTALVLRSGEKFLDFSKGEGAGGHYLSVNVCDDIDDSGRLYLRDRGWYAPDSNDVNWRCSIEQPGPDDYREIAMEAVEILREGFGATSPMDLRLDGWVECNDWQVPFDQLRGIPSAPTSGDPNPLLTIADALLGDHEWLIDSVRYMLQDSATDRGLSSWTRMLDCLGDCSYGGIGVFAQFWWKQDAQEIRERLQRSIFHPTDLSWDWFPDFVASAADWHPGDVTEVLLNRVGEHCGPLGFALVSFVTEGDDYAVTFVPVERVDQLNELVAAAGQRIHTIA
ncbi:hypothetical protein ACFXO9_31645 [Nocardia tengchongensis]|uniref:DUF6630 family protein n=1 Tax=Nocardia tengchongensis TaxID=2055889 RepID=UPI0036957000